MLWNMSSCILIIRSEDKLIVTGTITTAMPNTHIKIITSCIPHIRKTTTGWQKCIDHLPHLRINKILTPCSKASEILTTQSAHNDSNNLSLDAHHGNNRKPSNAQRRCVHCPQRCGRRRDYVCSQIKMCRTTSKWKWGIIDMIWRATPHLQAKQRTHHIDTAIKDEQLK